MKTRYTLALLLLLGGALLVQERRHAAAEAALSQRLQALSDTVSQAREEGAAEAGKRRLLQDLLRGGPAAPQQVAAEATAKAPAAAPRPGVRREETAERFAARTEQAFSREAVDAAWAPAARQKLRERAAALLGPGSSLRALDCRASLCRLEVTHPSEEERRRFTEQAFLGGPGLDWEGQSFSGRGDDPQGLTTVAYLLREGQTRFPEADGEE